tara:strand:+ start:40 stop:750 length:711 start_codon:yes stop_codon:yes gene_type:complete
MSKDINLGKEAAAREALKLIKTDMILGLGTGSTAKIFVDLLANKYFEEKLNIKVLSTSSSTASQARRLGLPLTSLNDVGRVDIVVDGADEVDSNLNLIKGGGGALLQEKIVAECSGKMIVIVDEGKIVTNLGRFPLPIEIIKFGSEFTRRMILEELGNLGCGDICANWRKNGKGLFLTDEGHYILDLNLNQIKDPVLMHDKIKAITGVVETGLFINLANLVIIGDNTGQFTLKGQR